MRYIKNKYSMSNLDKIFQTLDIDADNGLYYTNDTKWKSKLQFPNRIVRLLEKSIKPDAFFCIDNKPLILFFENPTDTELHKKIWNFNETPIVIISQNDVIEIFNGFKYEKELNSLALIGGIDKLNDFTYFQLFTDKTWEDYREDFKYENRLDYFLLHNIKAARNILKKQIDPKIANALIGKCIFVCYLIDRGVYLSFEGKGEQWKKEKFCEILQDTDRTKKFFDYLKEKFNGDDIFAISDNEYTQNATKDSLNVLIRLLNGEDLEKEQPSFFSFYDFSIIPIEFISNVYELFIGEEDQEDKGAYYTPLFLVDYILKKTVEKHFENHKTANGCVTLDPACGSGVFLVETLRKIVENYQSQNQGTEITPENLKKLAIENIYGIDKDPNAIQVAMFSIYLTLLDYQDPADIETFKFPPLLNSNFFEADFFNTDPDLFETKLQKIEFDYILGNPPWYRGKNEENPQYIQYIEERKKKENISEKIIGNKEIAQAFLLRSSDFSTEKTKCALIVTSKVLYNSQSIDFRRHFLRNYLIDRIFELAPVNWEIFNSANNPACVLFFKYARGKNTDNNILEHITIKPTRFFSYFKIFTINRPDCKKVEQKLLKDNDWLFKTLVYGSYLDFNLITRLKKYTSIKDTKKFIFGTGVQFSKKPIYDAKHLYNYPFIEAEAIEPFFINPKKISIFTIDKLHRKRDKQLFSAPMLLIRKGLDSDLLIGKAAISVKDAVFKDSVTSLKSISNETDTLKYLLGIFSSNLYTYFAINTFSSIGIERKQSQSNDKFSVPYIEFDVDLIETIEKAKIELYNLQQQDIIDNIKCSEIQKTINNTQNKINDAILQALNFNEIEKSLLDYALNINRPLITRTETDKYDVLRKLQEPLKKRSNELIEYANVYLNRFKRNINNEERKFVVRVWHTNQLLGMFFEVVPIDTPEENGIIWKDATDRQILYLLIKLSSEKITDKLFVQKDIRGFEKERFYICKPNEKRLWHKAIAYLDAEEFMDAILKAGRRGE
jgi:hypothetical protein